MIQLTRLNGRSVVVNPEVIESLEATPDTLISLTSGQKLTVRETVDEVAERFIAYQQQKLLRLTQPEERSRPCVHPVNVGHEDR